MRRVAKLGVSTVGVVCVIALVAACGQRPGDAAAAAGASGAEATGSSRSAISFSDGNNDGYCASNPSALCWQGTPVGQKQLVLTFDDGPGTQTVALSSWLAAQGIRATFFPNGKNYSGDPANVLSHQVADGHLVGNHTQDHFNLTTLSNADILSEVTETDAIVAPYVDLGHFLFRAPYGAWDSNDYAVLHGSAMAKYVGPVKWDIGGQMTDSYAADWDCWQNTSGYGVLTTKECGDRYLQEITDVGRGIILMHDQDYGDVSNHDLTSGEGNTIDMVKYIVPILQQRGYTFLRADDVPDITAALGGGSGADAGGGGGTDAGGGGGSCAFDPTWGTTTYANDWWVELTISGDVASATLEVVGGQTVTLSASYDKWVGSPTADIPRGTQVIAHATSTSNESAATKPFAYLVTTTPVTSCGSEPTDAGAPPDAGPPKDAGAPKDSGTCTLALNPTWAEGDGANTWWVEYTITAKKTIASASLEVVGGDTLSLAPDDWGKWVGSPAQAIPAGTNVVVHATDTAGDTAQTSTFGYLNVTAPTTEACRR